MIKTDIKFSGIFPGHPPGPPVQKRNRLKTEPVKTVALNLRPE
jgi:hypothetical protein